VWQRKVKWGIFLAMFFTFWITSITQAAPLTASATRLYGPTRIETAIRISQEGWTSAQTVLLARADDFPDSLVSVPLSKRLNAPILLTYPDQLDSVVLEELKRLGSKHVVILGGAGVMGETITSPLEQANLTWERIGGTDRYDTAVQVAKRLGGNGQVILTSGENFPDALAIGPYAGQTETPILLTAKSELPKVTQDTLQALGAYKLNNGGEAVAKTYVIGGEGVVSLETTKGLSGMTRISGKDRYETAARVFWFMQDKLGVSSFQTATNGVRKVFLVTGENFPDALVAGALAVKQNTFLFMSAKEELPVMTYSSMGNAGEKLWAVLVGSQAILSERVQGMVEGSIIPPYLLAGMTIVVDPGHGGKDTGAIGSTGTYEKNNTLPVGLYLADLLRQAGAKVILTRSNDSAPSDPSYTELKDLQTRVQIANQINADLYVSIHNDAFSNPEAGGTTTYVSLESPQAEKARKLAEAVQQEVVKQVNLQNRKVKSANFYVIKNTTMPSILVELGFISNPTEEKLLASSDFQIKAATGIYRGILIYQGF
jgi:N-acetylmuramoyl-L-alanine amidase